MTDIATRSRPPTPARKPRRPSASAPKPRSEPVPTRASTPMLPHNGSSGAPAARASDTEIRSDTVKLPGTPRSAEHHGRPRASTVAATASSCRATNPTASGIT